MPTNDFLQQFMAGWGMGMDRVQQKRRDEMMARQAEQEQYRRQQDAEERALRMEALKFEKQQADQQIKRQRLEDAFMEHKTRAEALAMQSSLPTPTAAEVGIPEQGPEFGGPMASQIEVPQPMQALPSLMGGPDIQMPIPTGRQQQEMEQAAKQKKMLEALGMLRQQEAVKAEFRQPERPVSVSPGGTLIDPSTGKVIFRAPEKASAAGSEAGGSTYGTAKSEAEKKAVDTARFALGKMPEWEAYIQSHQDIFGPVAGRVTQFRQSGLLPEGIASKLGMSVDPEVAKRQAEFAVMRNNMINSLSGAAVSPAEFERLKEQIPELTDPPIKVQQKLSVLKDYFQQKLQAVKIPTPGAAAPSGGAPSATAPSKYKIIEVR